MGKYVTDFMDKFFSDSASEEFKSAVSDKIEEARTNGQAELRDGENQLNFSNVDGDIFVEDVLNGNEVTIISGTQKNYSAEGVMPEIKSESPTQPNVVVPKPEGEDKKPVAEGSTEDDVVVTVEPAIKDKDKAGDDKEFSLKFSGFKSREEAQQFFSDNFENTLNFSTEELDTISDVANEMFSDYERLMGTGDLELAINLRDTAERVKAYSVLAESYDCDMNQLYEYASAFSDYAAEVIANNYANMDINEYFSQFNEDELNEIFSEMNEVEVAAYSSALADEEDTYTFSEMEEIVNDIYSEIELQTPVNSVFSDVTEEEFNSIFSDLTDNELAVVSELLNSNENVTFSDINDAIDSLYEPLNSVFSNMTEEELAEYASNFSERECMILDDMMADENMTYSDWMTVLSEYRTFSEEDVPVLNENIKNLDEGSKELAQSGDVELAKRVKLLADDTIEDLDKAEEAGYDVADAKDAVAKYSEKACECLDKAGVDPASVNHETVDIPVEGEKAAKEGGEKPAEEKPKKIEVPEAETKKECDTKTQSAKTQEGEQKTFSDFSKYLGIKSKEVEKLYSDKPVENKKDDKIEEGTKVFAKVDDVKPESKFSPIANCLFSKIN